MRGDGTAQGGYVSMTYLDSPAIAPVPLLTACRLELVTQLMQLIIT